MTLYGHSKGKETLEMKRVIQRGCIIHFFFVKTGFHYVALYGHCIDKANLELTEMPCLCHPSAGVKGLDHRHPCHFL